MLPDDQNIAYAVERALGQLPGVNLGDFDISVDKGRVRLQGVVHRLADKQQAIETAMTVPGVLMVDDGIAVETPHPKGDRRVEHEIGRALDDDEEVDAMRVGAHVTRGQAIIQGTAESVGELGRAVTTTGGVPDAVNVIDSSRIDNPYGADRIALANAIADAFRNHPVLHNRAIRPRIEDTGRVVLTGEVRSEAERAEALSIAANVPGAHTIHEELEIIP